jgi:hypothetical protein
MEKITDPRHTLAVINEGISSHRAAAIEKHIAENSEAYTASTAAEFFPVVKPALSMIAASLPAGSAWSMALVKFIDLMDAETGEQEVKTTKTKGKGNTAAK